MNSETEPEKYRLPNGLEVYHHNAYETDFLYREIFEEQIYGPKGISFAPDSVVVDVGANIGLFALYVKQQAPDARLYAFEPSPHTVELLKRNMADLERVKIIPKGLGLREEQKTFTYYPGYSIMSGFHASDEEDKKLLSSGIATQLKQAQPSNDEVPEHFVQLVLGDKLENGIAYKCNVTTLSAFINKENLQKIDLLKIDAEKSEIEILQGIEQTHWPVISQIIIEAHNAKQCQQIKDLLSKQGYALNIEQQEQFSDVEVYNIYGIRQDQQIDY
jgi:FkbM family methyltransferase